MPHFDKSERALFIATGKQVGKIYLAEKGVVREVASVFEPKQRYSDNEGLFMRSGSGTTYGAGSVREPKDTETKRKFLRKFGKEVAAVISGRKKVDSIYLFTPDYEITELREALPKEAREKIRLSFRGNFVKFGPELLLSKVEEKLARIKDKNELRKEEEVKILKRPRGATKAARKPAPA